MAFSLQAPVLNKGVSQAIFGFLFLLINLLSLLLIIIMTIFTLKLRKNELGLFRCSGATRGDIITLIINESMILSIIVMIFIVLIEFIFIYNFRFFLAGFLNTSFDLPFFLTLLKGFLFSFFFIFILLFLTYIPFGFYYAYKDPYNIVRY
ncbi:MAG: hypothetical protein KKH98_00175 [Spirochaetes bacterium]|nr:hypothetical protein [Spirochaetota bacterium]